MTQSVQGKQYEDICKKEAQADGAITPGELLTYSGSDPLTVTSGAAETFRVAMENNLPPHGTDGTDPIDDDYADGENVHYRVGRPGDTFDNVLSAVNGLTAGDIVEVNSGGRFVTRTAGSAPLATAVVLEGGDAGDRITVEVL